MADPNGPYLLDINNAVTFDGTGSYGPDGLTFDWDFGDGTTATDAGATPTHTYAEAGIYNVCLTVNFGDMTDQACTQAVAYDPSAGFVTGGGWIDSAPLPFFDGSYYELVADSLTWSAANAAASARELEGCGCAHLVTITSQEEQDFIYDSFGGTAIAFHWLGANLEDGEWQWVTGEPWEYTNWEYPEVHDELARAAGIGGGGTWCPGGWCYSGQWFPFLAQDSRPYIVEYEQCAADKANFGFVAKYRPRATVPTGNIEFQFPAADLNFHSDSFEWLVVTGSDYARFKGVGTINGEGEYKLMLWAGDGTGTDGADTFRIKIWTEDEFGVETVVYDNGMDQDIARGSIIVHTK